MGSGPHASLGTDGRTATRLILLRSLATAGGRVPNRGLAAYNLNLWQSHLSHAISDRGRPESLGGDRGGDQAWGSKIFFSITARVTDNVEIAIPILAASSVNEILRGTSKYPSAIALRSTSC